jgi:DNA-binding MarR family transcriptional regulator
MLSAAVNLDLIADRVDQSCLAHLFTYQIALADIPARRSFAKHVGVPLGLRPVEFTTLVLVAFNPGLTQKQLAQVLALSAPNITILIDRLEHKGWLERVRSETDRRAQNIHLTPAGRTLAEQAHAMSKLVEQDLLTDLTQGERALLLELLQKVARTRHD